MQQGKLEQRIAQLESLNDQLMTELGDLDGLMRQIGFSHGLATLKETAKELSKEQELGLDCD